MSLNIVENLIRQQIPGREAVGQQFADLRRRDGELGHREGDDAPRRPGVQPAGVRQTAVGELACQFVRQAGDFNGKARPVRDGDMGQRTKVAPAVPARQPGKGIGADQQHQRLRRAQFAAQAFQRMHGVARCRRFDFAGID